MTTVFSTVSGFFRNLISNMAEDEGSLPKGLFSLCKFAVVRSNTLSAEEANRIVEQLKLHGGEVTTDQYPEERLNLQGITHIISTTFDFPDYNDASDQFIPVIKPGWIDASLATSRLANPRKYSPDPRLFMSDVIVTCCGLPEGDSEAIAGGVLAMGGNHSSKLTSQITHIVTLSMESEKVRQAQAHSIPVQIVLPHWFDDCLKLGKKIDEGPYLLPDPEILRGIANKAPSGKLNKHVAGASSPDPQNTLPNGPKPLHPSSLKVFKNKTVVLENDLGVSLALRDILCDMIKNSGGSVAENASTADMLVCKYREGMNYMTASQAGIDVGNLAWLFYLIVHDTWTSPFRRLLHYPIARGGLPGFQNFKISLSNYSGEARTYLENLIKATGAECTKTLRQENTHLITAHTLSEKVAAARDWNVNVINHLWLEESYAKWKMQSITNSRYTHFPKKTNLGEVVGQTGLDRDVLEEHFYSKKSGALNSTTKATKSLSTALDPVTSKVNSRQVRIDSPKPEAGELQTPVPSRFIGVGKENITPGTTNSRRSKEAAAAKLHSMTPDIALYEKEKKRSGGVVYGGRKKNNETPVRSSRKRSVDAIDSDVEVEKGTKKQRTGPAPIEIHLLISGYKRWIGKPKEEDADLKRLRDLGVMVVTDAAKATHVAVPHILRTAKFIIALAYAPIIISTDFIDACLEKDEFLNPDKFKLKDSSMVKQFGVSLEQSRERANENKQQLLSERSIYCVEKIQGGFETYQAIVEANGGQCMTFRGRHTTMTSRRAGSDGVDDDDPNSEVYLLSTNSKEDVRLWPRFVSLAESARKTPRIVRCDWLLETAMCQEIQPTDRYELQP